MNSLRFPLFTVPCAGAPLVYSGNPTPTWLSALSADVVWGRWRLVGIAEFQGGHWMSDGNLGGAHVFFNDSKAAVEQTDPIFVALQQMGGFGPLGLMKAGFGKLRNLSLTYEVPARWAGLLAM